MVDVALLQRADPKQARFLVWQNEWRKTARPKQIPEVAAQLQG